MKDLVNHLLKTHNLLCNNCKFTKLAVEILKKPKLLTLKEKQKRRFDKFSCESCNFSAKTSLALAEHELCDHWAPCEKCKYRIPVRVPTIISVEPAATEETDALNNSPSRLASSEQDLNDPLCPDFTLEECDHNPNQNLEITSSDKLGGKLNSIDSSSEQFGLAAPQANQFEQAGVIKSGADTTSPSSQPAPLPMQYNMFPSYIPIFIGGQMRYFKVNEIDYINNKSDIINANESEPKHSSFSNNVSKSLNPSNSSPYTDTNTTANFNQCNKEYSHQVNNAKIANIAHVCLSLYGSFHGEPSGLGTFPLRMGPFAPILFIHVFYRGIRDIKAISKTL